MFGAIIPAPLAIPPTRNAAPSRVTCLGWVSVVRIAVAAAVASAGEPPRRATRVGAAAAIDLDRERAADQPGRADEDLFGADAERPGDGRRPSARRRRARWRRSRRWRSRC